MEKFIGCMISMDCGEALGTYQGQVIAINPVEGLVTIVQPYRNGVPFKSQQVTLRSQDIKRLSIVKSSEEVREVPQIFNRQISLLSASNNPIPPQQSTNAPLLMVGLIDQASASALIQSRTCSGSVQQGAHQSTTGSTNLGSKFPTGLPLRSPKSVHTGNNSADTDGLVDCLNKIGILNRGQCVHSTVKSVSNGKHHSSQMNNSSSQMNNSSSQMNSSSSQMNSSSSQMNNSSSGVDLERSFGAQAENKSFSARKRTSSASEARCVQQGRRATTPRKADRHQQQQQMKNNDCFNDSEVFDDDFDFEKNLALFNKQAVFEQIDKETENGVCGQNGRTGRSDAKYRCDENILQGSKAAYRQIKLLNGRVKQDCVNKEYTTDSGLVIPSVSVEVRERLLCLAAKYGFSNERIVEMVGRSASEMVFQLLGGNNRFDPKNSHQCPVVVVLCGTGFQAAIGINCARHLANRSVKVILFLSRSFPLSIDAESELQLYQLTNGKVTSDCADLPHSAVDMIVNTLDGNDDGDGRAWYGSIVEWVGENKARVLAIDPPIEGSLIKANWCLTLALPLSYNDRCGQVYLCDLSIPHRVYKEAGIVYRSPFAHKFVIPLHPSEP